MGMSDVKRGGAYVELSVRDKMSRGLARVAAKLKAFGAMMNQMGVRMMAAGAAVMTPLLGAAKLFADTGHDLVEMSARTGISVEALGELGYAAEQSGVSMEALGIAVKMMQKSIVTAAAGAKPMIKALAQLGLRAEDLMGLAPEKQFELLANQLSLIEDPAVTAAMAMKLFGRSGAALIPLLKDLEAKRQRARDMGFVFSTADAKAGAEFKKVLRDMWYGIKMAALVIGAALAPALKDAAVWIMVHVQRVTAWIRKNQGLVVSLLKASAYTMAAGAALIVLGKAIQGVGLALKLLSVGTSIVGTVLGTLVSTIAFMATPLGLVVTVAAAVAAGFLYMSGAAGAAAKWLGERFGELKSDALKAFQGISDALAAGDIGLAAEILWLTLKMWWLKGMLWLQEIWHGVELWFRDAWYGLAAVWTTICENLGTSFLAALTSMAHALIALNMGMYKLFQGLFDWVMGGLKSLVGMIPGIGDAMAGLVQYLKDAGDWNFKLIREGGEILDKIVSDVGDPYVKKWGSKLAENIAEQQPARKAFLDRQAAEEAETAEELRKARLAWIDSRDLAAKKLAEAEKPGAPGKPKMPSFDLGQMAAELSKNLGARGTFNAAAIQGLMGGDALERTADAAEETAENTARMREQLEEMEGMEFAE